MNCQTILYADARERMKAGDVIAFSGKGHFSELIKWSTKSTVSHVGIILQSQLLIDGEQQAGFFNQIIESTSLNGFSGVAINRLSDRLDTYSGGIWWLPLEQSIHDTMDKQKFYDFLLHQQHKEYDMPQAVRSALDAIDNLPGVGAVTRNEEDFAKFFCSELAAAGLEAAGAIEQINASEVTPIDLCSFSLYEAEYFQLKGDQTDIPGYNSIDPKGWGG